MIPYKESYVDSRNLPKKFLSYVCTGFLKSFLSLSLKWTQVYQFLHSDSVGGWSFSTFCNRKSTKNVREILRVGGPKKFAIL